MKTRNLICYALAVILVGACNTAEIDNPVDGIAFQASFESPIATRTVRQEDGSVYWSPNDEIALFYGDGNKMAKFISDNTETAAQATFRGTLSSYKYSEGDEFVAVYPYNENTKFDGSSVSVDLPSSQKAVAGTFDKDLFITVAKSDDFNLSFYNVCGGIKFSLANEGIKAVRLKGNNGETLAGTLHVSFGSDGYPAVDSITDGESEISVTPSDGATFQTGVYYYAVLPPLTFSEGFTMTLVDSSDKEAIVYKPDSRTVKRSTFGVLNNVDDKSASEPTGSYLTFKSEGTSTLSLKYTTSSCPSLEYSYDLSTWTSWTNTGDLFKYDALTIKSGQPLYIRGMNTGGISKSYDEYAQFVMTGDNVSCSGSIMSLLDYTEEIYTISSRYCFYRLFRDCTQLTTAPELPATTLALACYENMFMRCTSLTDAPALPATMLAKSCYEGMFSGCTNLAKAPALPATKLDSCCYARMFSGCTTLTEVPELPATTLAYRGYIYMFSGCTSLIKAPELPAKALALTCYQGMFNGCTTLTEAPALPATKLEGDCYWLMFSGCTSLTTAPALPATILASGCYKSMFSGCTSLTSAPALPAVKLASFCYEGMFSGCTSLVKAPILFATKLKFHCCANMFSGCTSLVKAPILFATELVINCYDSMFKGCSSLNSIICMATNISARECTDNWLDGVASEGVFYKSSANTQWSTGSSGVPDGWQLLDYELPRHTHHLTFTTRGESAISMKCFGAAAPYIEYSRDSLRWIPWEDSDSDGSYDALEFSSDQPLYLCGRNASGFSTSKSDYAQFVVTGDDISCSGNIMSLLDYTADTDTVPSNYCFYRLFSDCTQLATAPELPATTLAEYCYSYMFYGCTGLATAPELPATTLVQACYENMFTRCTSLTGAPELPATTLSKECYAGMFSGCKSLARAPALPATTLAEYCYLAMFSECTSLRSAPELRARRLVDGCYQFMFFDCKLLGSVFCWATYISAKDCTNWWLHGVSSRGSFYKPYIVEWTTGWSGIPEGWKINNNLSVE